MNTFVLNVDGGIVVGDTYPERKSLSIEGPTVMGSRVALTFDQSRKVAAALRSEWNPALSMEAGRGAIGVTRAGLRSPVYTVVIASDLTRSSVTVNLSRDEAAEVASFLEN